MIMTFLTEMAESFMLVGGAVLAVIAARLVIYLIRKQQNGDAR